MSLLKLVRVSRSALFLLVYLIYLVLFMGFVQRFILVPLAWVFPVLTDRLLLPWSRMQASAPMRMLRTLAGVRFSVEGAIGPENRLVIMNHQSIIDIVLAVWLSPGYLTLIPARRRYQWGIPGISVYLRLARFPLISQTREGLRADLAMLTDSADRMRRGEVAMAIFPEGHRTKDGSILPFMTRGLRLVLSRAPLPVYCIVGDGMSQARTLMDSLAGLAGARVRVRIIGPFQPPQEAAEMGRFIESLRERMIATLADMRAGSPPVVRAAAS
jgi:1-acyl-sn-glycerol-3-phosphate acyltransferase